MIPEQDFAPHAQMLPARSSLLHISRHPKDAGVSQTPQNPPPPPPPPTEGEQEQQASILLSECMPDATDPYQASFMGICTFRNAARTHVFTSFHSCKERGGEKGGGGAGGTLATNLRLSPPQACSIVLLQVRSPWRMLAACRYSRACAISQAVASTALKSGAPSSNDGSVRSHPLWRAS